MNYRKELPMVLFAFVVCCGGRSALDGFGGQPASSRGGSTDGGGTGTSSSGGVSSSSGSSGGGDTGGDIGTSDAPAAACTVTSDCASGEECLYKVGDCSAKGECLSLSVFGPLCNIAVACSGCFGEPVTGFCGSPYALGPTLHCNP